MGPFIMTPEGVARLFVPLGGMAEGPFPEHYEPFESPVENLLHAGRNNNPVVKKFSTPYDKYAGPKDGYNVVCTTYRLTEHYHYWTKNNPVNVQLVPEPFIELSHEFANELGVKGGEKLKVSSIRGQYIAKAMVTGRLKPLHMDGKVVHQIGIPIHWGYRGIAEDAGRTERNPINMITPVIVDPNAHTPEFKAFLVKVERA
jgi:formate dehydrogenase major subunit